MDKSDRIRKMAIIADADCYDGAGNQAGKTILRITMLYASGEDRGEELEKRYECEAPFPEYLQKDLLRLGFRVNSCEQLKAIARQLVGIIVRVSLVRNGDTFRVYIDDYFGRGDPQKFKING